MIDTDESNNEDSAVTVVIVPDTDLGVTKTANKTEIVPGEDVTYSITVTNNGPDTLENRVKSFVLNEDWPPELENFRNLVINQNETTAEVIGSITTEFTPESGLRWAEGDLRTGQQITFNFDATAREVLEPGSEGDLTIYNEVQINTSTIRNQEGYPLEDTDDSNNRDDHSIVIHFPTTDLTAEKTASKTEIIADESLIYYIKITNNGDEVVNEFTIDETWPAEMKDYRNFKIITNDTSATNATAPGNVTAKYLEARGIHWTSGELNPGEYITFSMEATATDDLREKTPVENQACVDDLKQIKPGSLLVSVIDEQPEDNCSTSTTRIIPKIDLEIVKSANKDRVHTEEDLSYYFTVINHGEADAYGFTIDERWPAIDPNDNRELIINMRNIRVIDDETSSQARGGSISGDTDSFTWNAPSGGKLSEGEHITFAVDATAARDTVNGPIDVKTPATNWVQVKDAQFEDGDIIPERDTTNNEDEYTVIIVPTIDLGITKTAITKVEKYYDDPAYRGGQDPYRCDEDTGLNVIEPGPCEVILKGDSPYRPGESVYYYFTVENSGPATAYSLELNKEAHDPRLSSPRDWIIVSDRDQHLNHGIVSTVSDEGNITERTIGGEKVIVWNGVFRQDETLVVRTTMDIDPNIDTSTTLNNSICVDKPRFEPEGSTYGEIIVDTDSSNDCDDEDIYVEPPTDIRVNKFIIEEPCIDEDEWGNPIECPPPGTYQKGEVVKFEVMIKEQEVAKITRFRFDEFPEYLSVNTVRVVGKTDSDPAIYRERDSRVTATDPGQLFNPSRNWDSADWEGVLEKDQTLIFRFYGTISRTLDPVNYPFITNMACVPFTEIEDSNGVKLDDNKKGNNCSTVTIPICDPNVEDCGTVEPDIMDATVFKSYSGKDSLGNYIFNIRVTAKTNNNTPITAFSLKEQWPSQLEPIYQSTYPATLGTAIGIGDRIDWSNGQLNPGQSVDITIKAQKRSSFTTPVRNFIRLNIPNNPNSPEDPNTLPNGTCGYGQTRDDCADVPGDIDPPQKKDARIDKSVVQNGNNVTYNFTISADYDNTENINQFVLQEKWPAGVTPLASSIRVSGPGNIDPSSTIYQIKWVGSLPAGGNTTISIDANIAPTAVNGATNYVHLCIEGDAGYPSCQVPVCDTSSMNPQCCGQDREDCGSITNQGGQKDAIIQKNVTQNGSNLVYTFTISAKANSQPITEFTLREKWPSGIVPDVNSITTSGLGQVTPDSTGDVLVWRSNGNGLQPGQSETITINATANNLNGTLYNYVRLCVEGDSGYISGICQQPVCDTTFRDGQCCDQERQDCAPASGQSQLGPDATVKKDAVQNGETIDYTFTVTAKPTNQENLTQFTLTEKWPQGITPNLGSAEVVGKGTITGIASSINTDGRLNSSIDWGDNQTGGLLPGESTQVKISANAQNVADGATNYVHLCLPGDPFCSGPVCDTAQKDPSCCGNGFTRDDCASTTDDPNEFADATVEKESRQVGNKLYYTFKIKAKESNTVPLTNFVLEERWPNGIVPDMNSVRASPGSIDRQATTSSHIVWTGFLFREQTALIEIEATVDPSVRNATNYVALCVVGDPGYPNCPPPVCDPNLPEDPNCCDKDRLDCDPIPKRKEATVVKEGRQEGNNIHFTFQIKANENNNGNITTFVLEERWPNGVSPDMSSLTANTGSIDRSTSTRDHIVWNGSLAPGQTALVEIDALVSSAIRNATNYVALCIEGDPGYPNCQPPVCDPNLPEDPNCCDQSRQDCYPMSKEKDATIVKEGRQEGNKIYFTFHIKADNDNNGDINSYIIEERWPNGVIPDMGTLSTTVGSIDTATSSQDHIVWNGSLAPGQTALVEIEALVNASVRTATNYAALCIEGDPGYPNCQPPVCDPNLPEDPNCCDQSRQDCYPIPGKSEARIEKRVTQNGKDLQYVFNIIANDNNDGVVNSFALKEKWPAGITPDMNSIQVNPGSINSDQSDQNHIVWNGSLFAGQTATVVLNATIDGTLSGSATNYVQLCLDDDIGFPNCQVPICDTNSTDPACCDQTRQDCASVEPKKDASVEKSLVANGNNLTYTFRITADQNNTEDVNSFALKEKWPAGITPDMNSIQVNPGSIDNNSTTPDYIAWNGSLGAGQSATITINALASGDLSRATNYVRLCLEGDDNFPACQEPVCDTNSTDPACCDQTRQDCASLDRKDAMVEKRVDQKGTDLTYYFTIQASGENKQPVTEFVLQEKWPAGIIPDLSTIEVTQGRISDGSTIDKIVWEGQLQPGATAEISILASALEVTDTAANYVRLCVQDDPNYPDCAVPTCDTNSTDPACCDQTRQDCAVIEPKKDASIEKTATRINDGKDLQYTFIITADNDNTQTVTDFVLTEKWPAGIIPDFNSIAVTDGVVVLGSNTDQMIWTGNLENGESTRISLNAAITDEVVEGSANYVKLCVEGDPTYPECQTPSCDTNSTDPACCDQTRQDCATTPEPNDISIEKSMAEIKGDILTFNFKVTADQENDGSISSFELIESWPSELELIEGSYKVEGEKGEVSETENGARWRGELVAGDFVNIRVDARIVGEVTSETTNFVTACLPTDKNCEPKTVCDEQRDDCYPLGKKDVRIEKTYVGKESDGVVKFNFLIEAEETNLNAINNFTLKEKLPSQFTALDYSLGQGTASDMGTVTPIDLGATWGGSMEKGQYINIIMRARVDSALQTTATNYVRISLPEDPQDPDNPENNPLMVCNEQREDCAQIPPDLDPFDPEEQELRVIRNRPTDPTGNPQGLDEWIPMLSRTGGTAVGSVALVLLISSIAFGLYYYDNKKRQSEVSSKKSKSESEKDASDKEEINTEVESSEKEESNSKKQGKNIRKKD